MSGGYFDYVQYRIFEAADDLEQAIKNRSEGEYAYTERTLCKFELGLFYLRQAATYLHRIDYLLECDDGEDTFHIRLKEDLEKLVGEEGKNV